MSNKTPIIPAHHATTSLVDVLKPLTIGRVRDEHRMKTNPNPNRIRNRQPNRRQRITPPREHVSIDNASEDQDVSNTTTSTTIPSVEDSKANTSLEPSVVDEGEMGGGSDHGHGDDDDHDHATDHDDFTCQPTSSQHSAYIRDNLELLQKKCTEFHECTKEVYSAENFHRILSGGNIQLGNICGLMYPEAWEGYKTLNEHCSDTERAAIRQDIGTQLTVNLAEPPQEEDSKRNLWNRLKRCLNMNGRQGEQPIATACRLKKTSSPFLCDDSRVDGLAEDFFNHEMEHLHCSCKAITKEAATTARSGGPVPLPARIGIAVGGASLLIVLFVVVIILCFRHRKVKRELDKHRMQYLPSPHGEASAIYQEIGDRSQAMDALRRARDQGTLPCNYNFLGQAPDLPERYVKDISKSRSNLANLSEGDPEYLEPVPGCGKSFRLEAHINDAYNSSQGSSQRSGTSVYDLAKHPGPSPPAERRGVGVNQASNGTYFSPIQLNSAEEEHGGYAALGETYAVVVKKDRGGGGEEGDGSAEEKEPLTKPPSEAEDGDVGSAEEAKYFVLEPQNEASGRETLTAISGPTLPV